MGRIVSTALGDVCVQNTHRHTHTIITAVFELSEELIHHYYSIQNERRGSDDEAICDISSCIINL